MKNPCPSPRRSGRHRWKEVGGSPPDRRACCQCGATGVVTDQGLVAFVAPGAR